MLILKIAVQPRRGKYQKTELNMPEIPRTIIDFHVHLFPDKLFDAIWDSFIKQYNWNIIHRYYYAECIERLRRSGVGIIVYSNYAHRAGIAEGLNRWNEKILEEYDGLYCFAAYHPDDENAIAMAERLAENPKILGFKLQLLVQNFYPFDEGLFPLYELVIRKNKRILFHTGTGPVGNKYVGLEHFTRAIEKFPELPANVAHLGANEYSGFFGLLDRYPELYLDTAFCFLPPPYTGFNLGAEYLEKYKSRILYGSDYPNLILPKEAEIEGLLGLNLSQEFYNSIFYDNGNALIHSLVER
jgi:predicted TIM-barrel fold metal-dependent hydrolase